ncbi:MAG: hypothetical protein AAF899_07335 [Pseudomonadota bacterium]
MKTLVRNGLITSLLLGLPTVVEARDGHDAHVKMQQQWADARAGKPGYEKPAWMLALFGLERQDRDVALSTAPVDAAAGSSGVSGQ